jgi:uncharacterized protein involved in exopolysaccharide biosynthesis
VQKNSLLVQSPAQHSELRLRDVVATAFRHRQLVTTSFFGIMLGTVIVALLLPPQYEAEMKLLVKNRRVDPVVSANEIVGQALNELVTEEQINSEVELLKSDDVLRRVVVATGLQKQSSRWPLHNGNGELANAQAINRLRKHLVIEPIRKSAVIVVKYRNSSPQLAATVLKTLANVYLEKKVELERSGAQQQFFQEQADRYKQQMLDAETTLQNSGGVAPEKVRDNSLQKLAEFEATLAQTQAAARETDQRIHVLQQEQNTVPVRLTTQMRTADNPQLLQHLKGTLVDLQLKRVELLTKYQPSYRLVQEIDEKIAATNAAIAREENHPLRDQTTDQNPANQWVRSELAKAQVDAAALRARRDATQKTIAAIQTKAEQLNRQEIIHQNLTRAVKAAEANYLLYVRKTEEARISEELDQNRIVNVAIAQEARPPVLPTRSRLMLICIGLLLASAVSSALVFVAEWMNPFYRTPHEVTALLDLPVLASLPHPDEAIQKM